MILPLQKRSVMGMRSTGSHDFTIDDPMTAGWRANSNCHQSAGCGVRVFGVPNERALNSLGARRDGRWRAIWPDPVNVIRDVRKFWENNWVSRSDRFFGKP